MNRNEFIQKWEKTINQCKQLRNEEQLICTTTTQNSKEYKDALRRDELYMMVGSLLQVMLDDFKYIK